MHHARKLCSKHLQMQLIPPTEHVYDSFCLFRQHDATLSIYFDSRCLCNTSSSFLQKRHVGSESSARTVSEHGIFQQRVWFLFHLFEQRMSLSISLRSKGLTSLVERKKEMHA